MAGRLSRLRSSLEKAPWWSTSLVFGVTAAGALPPVHATPLLIPAFVGLVWSLDRCGSARRGFLIGWWFGLGFFSTGLYWVGQAFLIDAARYGLLAPVAVVGLGAGMALFTGLVAWLTFVIARWRRLDLAGLITTFAAVWTAVEWLRSWVFTGFPWNLIATTWTEYEPLMQTAAYLGPYGLGLLTIVIAAAPASIAATPGRGRAFTAVSYVLLAGLFVGGLVRLFGAPTVDVVGVRLRLVQPNIDQRLKWKPELRVGHVRRQMELSRRAAADGISPTHVIWAETAVPFNLAGDPALMRALGTVAPKGGLMIAGAPRVLTAPGRAQRQFNSLHGIDDTGTLVATYDKMHLVPFGEYVPFRSLLSFSKLTAGRLDFSPGSGPKTISFKGLPPASVLICYEAIFPADVVDAETRPGWLLNVTNDAWFGNSAGPYQHFAAARLRAVEQGLPLVRVANTGISAVVDSYGRIRDMLPLGVAGTLDSALPAALIAPPPYGRFGDVLTLIAVVVFLAAGPIVFGASRGPGTASTNRRKNIDII